MSENEKDESTKEAIAAMAKIAITHVAKLILSELNELIEKMTEANTGIPTEITQSGATYEQYKVACDKLIEAKILFELVGERKH